VSEAATTYPAGIPGARKHAWLPPVLLLAAVVGVYANSFQGTFLFDDRLNIHDNPKVHQLWPPTWMEGQRPVTNFTFAINWLAGGDDPWGYHLVNLGIHAAAGLLLFGVVRRGAERIIVGRAATWFAFSAALIWLVHPLQTQSVTYIVQRAESLMGMLYLLALYAAIRAHPAGGRSGRRFWTITATLACVLAQGAKPVAVTAPVMIVLFDRALLFPTFREAFRCRWGTYLALASTWCVPAALGVFRGAISAAPDADAGLGAAGIGATTYLYTQAEVIVHYLKLAFWPRTLVLDYLWPPASGLRAVLLPGLFVLGLLTFSLIAFRNRPWLGFACFWFFLVLAPTSSFIPIRDVIFEHRMYLPLAGVVVVALACTWRLTGWLSARSPLRSQKGIARVCLVSIAAVALSARTLARSRDYQSPITLWQRNAQDRPDNPRAYNNLCQALNTAGRNSDALAACQRALELAPQYADALNNLANVMLALDHPQHAAAACRQALAIRRDFVDAHITLGYALTVLGDLDGAIDHERAALAIEPTNILALNNLGNALARRGEWDDAQATFETALNLEPQRADTHNNLAWLFAEINDLPAAAEHLEQAVTLDPSLLAARINLGIIYQRLGRNADAHRTLQQALSDAQARSAQREIDLIQRKLAETSPP